MWKIQTPLVKVVYIWNVDYLDFGFDPPPLMDFFHNLWHFLFGLLPLELHIIASHVFSEILAGGELVS